MAEETELNPTMPASPTVPEQKTESRLLQWASALYANFYKLNKFLNNIDNEWYNKQPSGSVVNTEFFSETGGNYTTTSSTDTVAASFTYTPKVVGNKVIVSVGSSRLRATWVGSSTANVNISAVASLFINGGKKSETYSSVGFRPNAASTTAYSAATVAMAGQHTIVSLDDITIDIKLRIYPNGQTADLQMQSGYPLTVIVQEVKT